MEGNEGLIGRVDEVDIKIMHVTRQSCGNNELFTGLSAPPSMVSQTLRLFGHYSLDLEKATGGVAEGKRYPMNEDHGGLLST